MLLQHKKSTATEGWQVLSGVSSTAVVFVLAPIIARFLGLDLPTWFLICWYTFLAIIFLLGMLYAIPNIRAKATFTCELDEHEIRCVCPVELCGESFTLKLSEIKGIEHEEDEGSHEWYLVDASARRYLVPTNYGNPADEFIKLIKELKPELDHDWPV
ncbi:MAG: hypothetical protein COA78_25455 [Blastopirellula sp.]|nr:MAG: hypothetical protein COA78_25455 [Blastopirellula sp.]